MILCIEVYRKSKAIKKKKTFSSAMDKKMDSIKIKKKKKSSFWFAQGSQPFALLLAPSAGKTRELKCCGSEDDSTAPSRI